MTVITVSYPANRISKEQRAGLAESLTDAVLTVEVGQQAPAARAGFQVHFREMPSDHMAINGTLLSESADDAMVVDIAVMDGDWPKRDRAMVIENVLTALAKALNADRPAPNWWVNFRTIDEGSWGAFGGALSVLTLLDMGLFTEEKAKAIREAIGP